MYTPSVFTYQYSSPYNSRLLIKETRCRLQVIESILPSDNTVSNVTFIKRSDDIVKIHGDAYPHKWK